MKLRLVGHTYRYTVEQMQLNLFPLERAECTDSPIPPGEDGAVSTLSAGKTYLTAATCMTRNGVTARGVARCRADRADERARRQLVGTSYYRASLPFLPAPPPWGALSGVRPTKLVTRHLSAGGTRRSADRMLQKTYFVSPARRRLCLDAGEAALRALSQTASGDISLYVGIPFCPTRCVYCSFVSQSVGQAGRYLSPYLAALSQEIGAAADALHARPHRIRTVYFGGGTPTTLSTAQLDLLLEQVHAFDLSGCIEWTVEAGRPDTLDFEKLKLLHDRGVTRISINPQTMDDGILRRMGRNHTASQVLSAFDDARRAGHGDINMDLIAGLPTDTRQGFESTLSQVLALRPEAITVHTLALKRAATLYGGDHGDLPSAETVSAMLDAAAQALSGAGYRPYYLYRQKYMTGCFENVGWCLPGHESLYNIYIMEELHSILSLGAGGVTKRVSPDGKITRSHNPKYPEDYLSHLPRILSAKQEVSL